MSKDTKEMLAKVVSLIKAYEKNEEKGQIVVHVAYWSGDENEDPDGTTFADSTKFFNEMNLLALTRPDGLFAETIASIISGMITIPPTATIN